MFNQRKPRRFNYKSRLQKPEKTESHEELKVKWDEIRGKTIRKKSIFTSMPALILFLVSIFILIYILEVYIN
ncbi:MAG: hypothetical protein P8H40_04270 [Winogradskyella sp.]|nr:hypothetical protein [Winogradskyella sp.]